MNKCKFLTFFGHNFGPKNPKTIGGKYPECPLLTRFGLSKPTHLPDEPKKGFKLYWKRKSRRVGRPNIDWPLIKLIRRMQKENPLWSAQRIQGELAKLGFSVCDNTVAKYMRKPKTDPEKIQRWLTFLRNHAKYTVGIDFLVVRTISFKAIYVFIAISHDRRKVIHFLSSLALISTFKKLFFNRPVRARSVRDFCLLSRVTPTE